MRIWTLHPKYLDACGLVALWREALLAQAVLMGKTTGYVNHPQLRRFRSQASPVGSIGEYLRVVHRESAVRNYNFAASKIGRKRSLGPIAVARGQVDYEWDHLLKKLRFRDPRWRTQLIRIRRPDVHPLFRVVPGEIEPWEIVAG
jgi:hypothetical protein